jgi:hypothetical protein
MSKFKYPMNLEEGKGRISKLHKLILKNFAVPSEDENYSKSSRYKRRKISQLKIINPLDSGYEDC